MVKARPRKELLEKLHEELSSGKISKIRPFGKALQYRLENAGIDTEDHDYALGVEKTIVLTISLGKGKFV